MSAKRYVATGTAVVLVVLTLLLFSGGSMEPEPDLTGIVQDIRESSSGYTFTLGTWDGEVRCFCREMPEELSYVGVTGSMSDDGSIFFIEHMVNLDTGRRCPRCEDHEIVGRSHSEPFPSREVQRFRSPPGDTIGGRNVGLWK